MFSKIGVGYCPLTHKSTATKSLRSGSLVTFLCSAFLRLGFGGEDSLCVMGVEGFLGCLGFLGFAGLLGFVGVFGVAAVLYRGSVTQLARSDHRSLLE